jgi:hypothetical protein
LGSHIKYIQRGIPNSKIEVNDNGEYNAYKSKDLPSPYINQRPNTLITYKDSQYSQERKMEFEDEMIILPRTVLKLRASLKPSGIHVLDRIYYIGRKEDDFSNKFLLAILNSKIMDEFYEFYFGATKVGGGYYDLNGSQIKNLPIPKNPDNDIVRKVEDLVSKYISLKKGIYDSRTTTIQVIQIEKSLKPLQKQIDLFVDKLYNQKNG